MKLASPMLIFAAILLSLQLTGCNQEHLNEKEESTPSVEQEKQEDLVKLESILASDDMQALLREIRLTAGVAKASSLDQCQLLAVGAKPCGGPERFILYSTENTDEARLKALGERYTELSKARNEEQGLVSDCAVIIRPSLTLTGGVCIPLQTATH